MQTIEHNDVLEIAQAEHTKSNTTNKGEGNGRQGKIQHSDNSKGKHSIPSGPISLKVKFGSRSLMDVVPLIDDHSDKRCTAEKESYDVQNVTKNIDDRLEAKLQFGVCNGDLDNVHDPVADICLSGMKSSQDPVDKFSPSQEGTCTDNRCSDSGTSPDSEVINLVPNERDLEELNDLIISKPSVTLPGLRVYDRSKNGRKTDRLLSSGAKDLLTPDSMSNTQIIGQVIQVQGDSYYSDTSALITGQIGSANISSTEIVSAQVLPCSGVSNLGISCDTSKFESGVEGNIFSSLGTESVKLVSSHDGLNVFKGEKSNGFGKGSSQVPKPSNTSIKKGNKENQANKHGLRNESDDVKSLCKVKHHPETENEAPYKFGDFGSCNETLIGGTSDLDIMRTEVSEPYLKPRKAWVQCDDCQKWRRIASALADQIEETNCKWTCKDSLDRDFADCSTAQEKSNAEINAELEISDASGDEDTFSRCINSNRSGQKKAPVVHQSSWNLIKTNLILHRNRKNQPNDEIMVCHCKRPSDGRMGCGDGCLNRMLNVECVRGTCPCGELCSNQQFQKRNYSKLKWFKCGKKGYGLQLLEDVYEGHFLIEYVGEVLDLHAYEARQKEYALKGHKHFYFMTLNGSEVIDACAKGNLGRFINHSCDPNCRTEKWMVNGEVCIGLFALRDIKKGEEVTFDYNYVRVFGAAAKKCVCGSPHCRGYIGGDPLNAEVIVQDDSDDDYPEPVILCEYGDMGDELNNILSARNATDVIEITTQGKALKNKNKLDEPFIEDLERTQDTVDHENSSMDDSVAVISLKIKEETNKFLGGSLKNVESYETMQQGLESPFESSLQPLGLQSKDINNETMSQVKKECLDADKVSSVLEMEKISPSKSVRKKSSNGGVSDELSKPSRRSSSVKKGKLKYSAVNLTSQSALDSKLQIPQPKFKKPPYESSNGRFEEVEEKLNELLNHDGGISKRRDASRCYLKLLLLTAASGHGCNGEAIQSNRDLSMILDALLKTKSRTVLLDIINKNGLQMLHNIMKRYRREFNKIPILRKLLKILEYLAVKGILSPEHINGGPSRPGVESFRDSILRLTDHTDKQVHQIARNFRDRWIPKPVRKSSCIDSQVDLHSCSRYNRFSPLQDQRGAETSEKAESSCRLIVESTATADGANGSSTSCLVNGERKRKRKSRWDEKAEFNLDERVETDGADDPRQDIDDVPPGFSFKTSRVSCDASSSGFWKHPYPMVTGHLQQRFISQLPVSYGIPLSKVQQFGLPEKDRRDAWDIAPGVPFHPFPPLPTYPRDTSASMPSTATAGTFPHGSVQECYSAQKPPCLSHDGLNTQISLKQHDNLGRKYFRQQKHLNYSERVPCPRERSGGVCIVDSFKNSMHRMGVASRENESRSCQNTRNEKLAHKSQQNHS